MIPFIRYSLPNGLRVVHNYDPSVSTVAVDVMYNTGARDEHRDATGLAHLFEHLMFGGSVNVESFDNELENAGGTDNAWTSGDFTNFFEVLPAANVETAFHLESDRMLALSFSPKSLDVQKSVVVEEFKQQCLNRPYGDLMHGLRKALYSPSHPYSWPVIGIEPDHIARVKMDDVKNWFYAHFAPNNAVIAIAGNLPYDKGRRLVEKWFADIPARNVAPRTLPDPGFPASDICLQMKGRVPYSVVTIAIPMDSYGTHDYFVADCITDILSAGRSSRFFRRIIADGDGSIIDADASIIGSEHPGFVMLNARTASADEATLRKAADRMMEELKTLGGSDPASTHELERALNRFESNFTLSNLDILSRAQNLAMAEIHGEDINDSVARQRSITTADISRVAAKLASTPKVVLYYLPEESDPGTPD